MKRTHFAWIAGAAGMMLLLAVLILGQRGTEAAVLDPTAVAGVDQAEPALESGVAHTETDEEASAAAEATTETARIRIADPAPVRPVIDTVPVTTVTTQAPSSTPPAAQPSDDEILERLRATYAGLDALRARFTQQAGGQVLQGSLVLSGERYRIEVADQVLVSDGTTAWAYSESDNQVLINHHMDDEQAFSPSAFFSNYPDHFDIVRTGAETVRGARHDVLRLTPRDSNMQVREVTLYVRSSDSMPTRVRLVDTNGQTLVFDLSEIERNPRLAADTFRFTAPAGAEVIDLR